MALKIARLVNMVLAGLLTGNEFGSWVTVHPSLDSLPPQAHLLAEQAVTRRYGRIQPVFMSTTIASFLPVLALTRNQVSAPYSLSLAGLFCYVAMLVITLTGNLPINKRLLELFSEATPGEEFRRLRVQWNRFHMMRNVLNLTGLIFTVLGALSTTDQAGT